MTPKTTIGSVIGSKFFKMNWREKRVVIFKGWLYAKVPFDPIFIIFTTLRRGSILHLNFHFQSPNFAFCWLLYFYQQLFWWFRKKYFSVTNFTGSRYTSWRYARTMMFMYLNLCAEIVLDCLSEKKCFFHFQYYVRFLVMMISSNKYWHDL